MGAHGPQRIALRGTAPTITRNFVIVGYTLAKKSSSIQDESMSVQSPGVCLSLRGCHGGSRATTNSPQGTAPTITFAFVIVGYTLAKKSSSIQDESTSVQSPGVCLSLCSAMMSRAPQPIAHRDMPPPEVNFLSGHTHGVASTFLPRRLGLGCGGTSRDGHAQLCRELCQRHVFANPSDRGCCKRLRACACPCGVWGLHRHRPR